LREIENKAVVSLEACNRTIEVASNEITTKPIKLRLEKKQDCDIVLIGENVKFTIEIENQCSTDVENLMFKDRLHDCFHYVEGSFRVNGIEEHPELEDRTLIFEIDQLRSCESVTIEFEVTVTDDCCDCTTEEQSATPTVMPLYQYSPSMNGTGISGATIYVERPSGAVVQTTVYPGGHWNLTLPAPYPSAGQIYKVWQVEPGKEPSEIVTITV